MSFAPRDISLLKTLRRLRGAPPLSQDTLTYLAEVKKREESERTREIRKRHIPKEVVTSSNRLNGVEVWARQFYDLREDGRTSYGGERSVVRSFPQKVLQCVDSLKGGETVKEKTTAVFICNPEQNMTRSMIAEVLDEKKETVGTELTTLEKEGLITRNEQPICLYDDQGNKACSPKILGENAYYMQRHLREAAGVPKDKFSVEELLAEWWITPPKE